MRPKQNARCAAVELAVTALRTRWNGAPRRPRIAGRDEIGDERGAPSGPGRLRAGERPIGPCPSPFPVVGPAKTGAENLGALRPECAGGRAEERPVRPLREQEPPALSAAPAFAHSAACAPVSAP